MSGGSQDVFGRACRPKMKVPYTLEAVGRANEVKLEEFGLGAGRHLGGVGRQHLQGGGSLWESVNPIAKASVGRDGRRHM